MSKIIEFILNNKYIILILLLAAILLFTNLGKIDMEGDQAHYAFRSVGYMDYLGSETQTTPLQWFDEIPWWSKLSFHDHPPLVFLLQHISMKVFGVSAFAARLPSALAGLLTIFFIYLIGQILYSKEVGLLSSLVLTVSNYFIWISKTALLEGVMIFFITLSIYFFIKSWSNTRYLFLWGIALGLAFISKYIAFYLIPVYLLFILFKKRDWLKDKNFWLSLVLILIICCPVIIYNFMMFSERGHLDMQFNALFHQSDADWPLIQRSPNFNFKIFLTDNLNVLNNVYSSISLFLFAFSLLFFLCLKNNQHKFFVITSLIFVLIGVTILGSGNRYLSVISIYLALISGFFLNFLLKSFNDKKVWKFLIIILLFLLLSIDLLYTINNNVLPLSISEKLELSTRSSWVGYNKLDEYFQNKFNNQCSTRCPTRGIYELNIIEKFGEKKCEINNNAVIIYDDKMNWFETIWIFDKLRIYQGLPAIHAGALNLMISDENRAVTNGLNQFSEFYFVSLEDESIVDKYSSGVFDSFKKQILEQSPNVESETIMGYTGSASFKIYKINNLKFY